MNTPRACLTIGCILTLLWVSASPGGAQAPRLASGDAASHTVAVRDVKVHERTVSGVVANTSPRLLRDVRVMIRAAWHWKNERHPGDDNPSRAVPYTVPGEVPAGGSLLFTYEFDPPLPRRTDGRFVIAVEVIGFTEVGE